MANVEDLVGATVEGWLLREVIGHGADGIVYAGNKEGFEAAIKLFFPAALAKNGLVAARERLELQLALVGKKHHQNLVEVYEGGEAKDLNTLFLVMELVPGKSLDKLIGQIPPEAVVPLAGQLAAAAKQLEAMELVHRDIKPANIVISDDLQQLTLLDLGIAHQLPSDEEQGRLSGGEFVATTRYSPPEFVWRKEEEKIDGAWQAVTFYQIGATLHDLIMGYPIFNGNDKPWACLLDAVRDLTPAVESGDVECWLIQTVQACLLKDWRQRLQFVSWDSFFAPTSVDTQHQERRIRLRQIRNEERRQAAAKQVSAAAPSRSREQHLWHLNNMLVLEVRTYLLDNPIFPKSSVIEDAISSREYVTRLQFDRDASRGFDHDVVFTINLAVSAVLEEATKLAFEATVNGESVAAATWTEMFSVETAFASCRQSFLDTVESALD